VISGRGAGETGADNDVIVMFHKTFGSNHYYMNRSRISKAPRRLIVTRGDSPIRV
jgi:hypothetical protein